MHEQLHCWAPPHRVCRGAPPSFLLLIVHPPNPRHPSSPSVLDASPMTPEDCCRHCERVSAERTSGMRIHTFQRVPRMLLGLALLAPSIALAQQTPSPRPWQVRSLPPERRALLLLAAMTPAEKFQQL